MYIIQRIKMFTTNLLIVLIGALLGRILSKKLKQPSILGELFIGMIIGNIDIITLTDTMKDIADIGILFLLFSAGLAINFDEFRRLGKSSTIVAFSGVVLPFLLGYSVTILFGFSKLISLFVGVSLIATSVGVKTEILSELKMIETRLGTLIMGAAVIDDVIGIIAVSIVVGIAASGAILIEEVLLTLFLSVIFLILSLTLVIKLFKKLSERFMFKIGNIENILLFGFIIALIFAVTAENIGLSIITGAFIAGLILGQTHFVRVLSEHVSIFGESLFIPIFFVTMGMQFNVYSFKSVGVFAIVLILVAIIGKIVGCGLGAKISKFTGKESFAVGVAMIPRAGVELVLIKLGLDYGVISSDIASVILCMVIFTTLITPPFLSSVLKGLKIGG
ncbi:cation:proton antiporter [Thermococci archaeon]|nr:MAG: cation:proton antiporter [Thermococci archaeon]